MWYNSPGMSSRSPAIKQYDVLVAVNFARISERDFFSGVLRFSHGRPNWRIRVLQSDNALTAGEVRKAERNGTDGIITCGIGDAKARRALTNTPIPVVLVGHHDTLLGQRRGMTSCVTVDNVAIGRKGAEFLSGLGRFAAYAYVPSGEAELKRMDRSRALGFTRYLRKRSLPASSLDTSAAAMRKWLKNAPKPAAILCANDRRAVAVLKLCESLGELSPSMVSVLGIDNDELYCRTSTPELSSIAVNPEEEGFAAAEQMETMLTGGKGRNIPKVRITAADLQVIERGSTVAVSPARSLIDKAEHFIRTNANKPIGVTDVVNHLQVSRRLAELRFRQFRNASIHELIVRARMEAFARTLAESNISIKSASAACGFRNVNYLKTMFRRHFGMTPLEYRRAAPSIMSPAFERTRLSAAGSRTTCVRSVTSSRQSPSAAERPKRFSTS